METLDSLRYPIGQFTPPAPILSIDRHAWVDTIAAFPSKLEEVVFSLTDVQLKACYRPGGWTIRQVIHHCADSHMNGFIRTKLALTEDLPTIKPYEEDRWAELGDTNQYPIAPSLVLLHQLHQRWADLFKSLSEEEWHRKFFHPANQREVSVQEQAGTYAWHGEHHLAHILLALKRAN